MIYSSSTRTNRVCPCHLIIDLKFTFYEHLGYSMVIAAPDTPRNDIPMSLHDIPIGSLARYIAIVCVLLS
ncbi:MAG: hypothetical protein IT420_05415 [Candidatus Brocadia sp.]|nr:hypothetical protein [Candidatus Brocadia sp.]MDG5996608.1 hypothetical protein [Candidatus Brocadia sp.]